MTCSDGETWIYDADGVRVAADNNRPDGHDACLGVLPSVDNACCGHGRPNELWVSIAGMRLAGSAAWRWIAWRMGGNDPPPTREGLWVAQLSEASSTAWMISLRSAAEPPSTSAT